MTTPRQFCIVVCFEDASRRRFLMVRHRTRGWELPGGRIEPGEEPMGAALREFREETGHELAAARLVLRQNRPNAVAWVCTGLLGATAAPRTETEPIRETRLVRRLSDVEPLAFPDDPYDEIETALGFRVR